VLVGLVPRVVPNELLGIVIISAASVFCADPPHGRESVLLAVVDGHSETACRVLGPTAAGPADPSILLRRLHPAQIFHDLEALG
jgi:hypothetical protein